MEVIGRSTPTSSKNEFFVSWELSIFSASHRIQICTYNNTIQCETWNPLQRLRKVCIPYSCVLWLTWQNLIFMALQEANFMHPPKERIIRHCCKSRCLGLWLAFRLGNFLKFGACQTWKLGGKKPMGHSKNWTEDLSHPKRESYNLRPNALMLFVLIHYQTWSKE